MQHRYRFTWAFALSAALAMGMAAVGHAAAQAMKRDGVPFVSGGVGVDAQAQLKAREHEFNLKLVFTLVEGNYVADVRVVVKDGAGRALVEHVATGPFFMAKLAPGTYSVEASYSGRALTRQVRIGDRLRTEYFRWPADPRTDLIVREDERSRSATAPAPAPAQPQSREPQRSPDRGVSFVSGGIGSDEIAALKAREAEYNLKLVFTLVEGNYVSDVGVVIRDAAGKTVVDTVAGGPIFLARLAPGEYTVTVRYAGKSQTRALKAGERLRTAYFRWKSDPATDLPVSRWLEPEAGVKPGAVR